VHHQPGESGRGKRKANDTSPQALPDDSHARGQFTAPFGFGQDALERWMCRGSRVVAGPDEEDEAPPAKKQCSTRPVQDQTDVPRSGENGTADAMQVDPELPHAVNAANPEPAFTMMDDTNQDGYFDSSGVFHPYTYSQTYAQHLTGGPSTQAMRNGNLYSFSSDLPTAEGLNEMGLASSSMTLAPEGGFSSWPEYDGLNSSEPAATATDATAQAFSSPSMPPSMFMPSDKDNMLWDGIDIQDGPQPEDMEMSDEDLYG